MTELNNPALQEARKAMDEATTPNAYIRAAEQLRGMTGDAGAYQPGYFSLEIRDGVEAKFGPEAGDVYQDHLSRQARETQTDRVASLHAALDKAKTPEDLVAASERLEAALSGKGDSRFGLPRTRMENLAERLRTMGDSGLARQYEIEAQTIDDPSRGNKLWASAEVPHMAALGNAMRAQNASDYIGAAQKMLAGMKPYNLPAEKKIGYLTMFAGHLEEMGDTAQSAIYRNMANELKTPSDSAANNKRPIRMSDNTAKPTMGGR